MSKNIKLLLLILLLTFYSFASNLSKSAVAQESDIPPLINDNGLQVTLITPWYVRSNSTFNITLVVEAAEANLDNIVLKVVNITTFLEENKISLLSEPKVFSIGSLDLGCSQLCQINITLPENSSKIVMGEIECEWNIRKGTTRFFQRMMFPMAVIIDIWREQVENLKEKLKELENDVATLQSKLNQTQIRLNETLIKLNQTEFKLNQTEQQLQGKIGELSTTQRLAVIFGVTTALFVFTTVYLFKRKPQVW